MSHITDNRIVFDSPMGAFHVEALGGRIVAAGFCDEPEQDNTDAILRVARKQFRQYFNGERRHFQLPLLPRGTAFQQQVWLALDRLDYAQTCTYADIARQLGDPNATRAVARAIGRNPIAVAIPCHRVVGQNGHLNGYAWGKDRKAWLLALERKAVAA